MWFRYLIKILPKITSKGSAPRCITNSGKTLRKFQNKVNHNNCLQVLMPGTVNTIRKLIINRRIIKTSGRSSPIGHKVDKNNLAYAKITNNKDAEVIKNIRIATCNARSVRNKNHLIVQGLHDSSVDIAVITETWLKDTEVDGSWLNQSELKQCNYDILMHNRP